MYSSVMNIFSEGLKIVYNQGEKTKAKGWAQKSLLFENCYCYIMKRILKTVFPFRFEHCDSIKSNSLQSKNSKKKHFSNF